jgi:2-haloacid dehalogenase
MNKTFYQLYVFDAYGTLFDVHSAIYKYREKLGSDGLAMSQLWRVKQLEYSWVRTSMRVYQDFWELTQQALDYALAEYPSVPKKYRQKLLEAYMELNCYDEVPEVLSEIKKNGGEVAILSNGSKEMLNAAIGACKLAPFIDAVISVDDIKCFKPDSAVYGLVTERFRVLLNNITFQSSNRWDIAAASQFGFDTAWINRSGLTDEYMDCPPKRILRDLTMVPNIKP